MKLDIGFLCQVVLCSHAFLDGLHYTDGDRPCSEAKTLVDDTGCSARKLEGS